MIEPEAWESAERVSSCRDDQLPGGVVPPGGGRGSAPVLRRASALLAILLPPGPFSGETGCNALRPLWAEEAMHRSYNLVRLAFMLDERAPSGADDGPRRDAELALAAEIATIYRTIAIAAERQIAPCSHLLRALVVDLLALFGPVVGQVELIMDVADTDLTGFQRRALINAASELVANALLHAFPRRLYGRLAVTLRHDGFQRACLTVYDDGVGYDGAHFTAVGGIASGLANLLASTIVYCRDGRGGTLARIDFALDAQERWRRAAEVAPTDQASSNRSR